MMRSKMIAGLLAGVAMLFAATAASAGTLTSATWFGSFQGTPYTLTLGSGLAGSGTSTGSSASVNIAVTPTLHFTTTQTGAAVVIIKQTLGGSANITASAGGAGATQGIAGQVPVILQVTPSFLLNLFTIPLSVGASGVSQTMVVAPLVGSITVTATFVPWQVGAYTATGLYTGSGTMTNPIADFMTAGSFNLTAGGGGTVALVAPSVTTVCAGAGCGTQNTHTASATRLVLNFAGSVVPEPGTVLLLAAGIAGLAAVGRRRS